MHAAHIGRVSRTRKRAGFIFGSASVGSGGKHGLSLVSAAEATPAEQMEGTLLIPAAVVQANQAQPLAASGLTP